MSAMTNPTPSEFDAKLKDAIAKETAQCTYSEYKSVCGEPNRISRAADAIRAAVREMVPKPIDERLRTAYELARAATETEEGRKAIDFFYHVHLNSYPGFGHAAIAEILVRIGGQDK